MRKLKTRIAEYKNHINRSASTYSVITNHRLHHSYKFDWENIKVLDNERFLNKRLISEILHMKLQNNSIKTFRLIQNYWTKGIHVSRFWTNWKTKLLSLPWLNPIIVFSRYYFFTLEVLHGRISATRSFYL